MWNAKYKTIDKNGLRSEIRITVEYSNGVDTLEKTYELSPEDFTIKFKNFVQNQLDVLESKDSKFEDIPFEIDTDVINT